MFEQTKRFCDTLPQLGAPFFDVAVYVDGKCVLRHSGGYTDPEKTLPVTGQERYNIYSCSKAITCTAAMQLWEKGLFSLEDPLAKYMPEFAEMTVKTEDGIRPAEKQILIRHLFEMTAGFSYALRSPQLVKAREETDGCPTREVMRYLALEPLLFEPGDRWNYSLCHDVLAALVEVLSGQRFEDYVHDHIFVPLGMDRSTFVLPEAERESLVTQYRFNEEKRIAEPCGKQCVYMFGSRYASGGAGCVSTVDDYMKFLEGLRTGKLLKPETVKLMHTDRLTEHQKRTYTAAVNYGYGLGQRCPKEGGKFVNFGWGGAAGAYHTIDPECNMSVYMGMHLLNSPVQGIRGMVYRFARAELFGTESIEALWQEVEKVSGYKLTY